MKINIKFLKGIGIMAAYVYANMMQPNFVWLASVIVAVCMGATYYIKNYYVPSGSAEGEINFKDFGFAMLLALFAAIGDGVSDWVINGVVQWSELWKVASAAIMMYLFPTLFQGPKVYDVQPDPNDPKPR